MVVYLSKNQKIPKPVKSKYLIIEVEVVYGSAIKKRKRPARTNGSPRKSVRVPKRKPVSVSKNNSPEKPVYIPELKPTPTPDDSPELYIHEIKPAYIPGNSAPRKPVYVSEKRVHISENGSLLKLTGDVLNGFYRLSPDIDLKRKGEDDSFAQILAWRRQPDQLSRREKELVSDLREIGWNERKDFFNGVGMHPHIGQPQLSRCYGKSEDYLDWVFSRGRNSMFDPERREELVKYLEHLKKEFGNLGALFDEVASQPLGEDTKERALLEIYSRTHDPIIEAFFAKRYEEYVQRISRSIAASPLSAPMNRLGLSEDDFKSCGWMGFLEQLRRFDPAKQNKLVTYAQKRVRGEMTDEARRMSFAPRLEFIRGNIPPDALFESLDDPICNGDKRLERQHLLKIDYGRFTEDIEKADLVKNLLSSLTTKERKIMELYYMAELTMREIGLVMDLSESRVCQLHSRARGCLVTAARDHPEYLEAI